MHKPIAALIATLTAFLPQMAALQTVTPRMESPCRILLIGGASNSDGFDITFMVQGHPPLAVRRLEFNCRILGHKATKSDHDHCIERNASFLPGNEYTVNYTYPGGKRGTVVVSLRAALLSDRRAWKPSKQESCRVLRIRLEKNQEIMKVVLLDSMILHTGLVSPVITNLNLAGEPHMLLKSFGVTRTPESLPLTTAILFIFTVLMWVLWKSRIKCAIGCSGSST